MNRFYLPLIFVLIIAFISCNNTDDLPTTKEVSSSTIEKKATHFINQEQAINIANIVLNQSPSRSLNLNDLRIEYVMSTKHTRSTGKADTLAYVINFPNNKGFAVIASDNRVYPVLAFSNQGHFSFSNEIANNYFITNIESYLENANEEASYEVTASEFDGCYSVNPLVKISIGQGEPWNKYVVTENPGCLAGCVAVATALVISHSTFKLTYHGVNYPMKSIISAINQEQGYTNQDNNVSFSHKISGGPSTNLPTYSYEQAVDSMAKILYWIGKDVNMKYGTSSSSANSHNAYTLCKSLNFSIPSGYASFNLNEIIQYLKDDHIVYMRGSNVVSGGGHAWVSDGCYFCVDYNDETQIYDAYIHCDWGWDGSCNGYYSGSVFEAGDWKYRPANYFALKRDPLLSTN